MDEELLNQFSSILKDKGIDPNELLTNLSTPTQNTSYNSDSNDSSEKSNIDIETIMKIKTLLDTMNQKDDRSNLLYALKPYMRESRKEKIDQYAKLLKLTKAFEAFQRTGENNDTTN